MTTPTNITIADFERDAEAIRREASKIEDTTYYAENLLRSLARLDPEPLMQAVDNVNGDTPDAAEMLGRLADVLTGLDAMADDLEPFKALSVICGRCGRRFATAAEFAARTPNRCRCGADA